MGVRVQMAKKTARQRLEDWASNEKLDLTYSMQFDHEEGIGWNISLYVDRPRREPAVNFEAHHHSIEEAAEGVLRGLTEYGITVPEGVQH
jgi:hypothetical protein